MKILLCLLLNLSALHTFDPSAVNYCKLSCGTFISSGCKCKNRPGRTEITENMSKFRKLIVKRHNDFRNMCAGGGLKDYPPAANMHVINYDLELEHVARCYALSTFENEEDDCPQTSFCQFGAPGQNLCVSGSVHDGDWNDFVNECFDKWVSQQDLIPRCMRRGMIAYYHKIKRNRPTNYFDFIQIVWASVNRIGCVRMKNPKAGKIKSVLICNYAGPDEYCATNIWEASVYTTDTPCSQCGREKCAKEYTKEGGVYENLCGKLESVPKDTIITAPSIRAGVRSSAKRSQSVNFWLFPLCTLASMFLVYI